MTTQAPPTIELWLLGWSTRHNTGNKIEFAISDEDLELFKSATTRSKGHAGQRYAMVCVQLDDDERPKDQRDNVAVKAKANIEHGEPDAIAQGQQPNPPEPNRSQGKHKFPDGLCGLAVRWCDDEHFQTWLSEQVDLDGPLLDAEGAKGMVCSICGVASRKSLDEDAAAAAAFRSEIMVPYAARRKKDGLDDEVRHA